MSLLALIGAGLFLRSLYEAQRLNPGFRTEGLAVMFVNVGAQGYSPQRGTQFFRDTVERVRHCPACNLPPGAKLFPSSAAGRFAPHFPGGSRAAPGIAQPLCSVQRHLAGLLCDRRHPDSQGRDFSEADREGTELVAIVNETTARMFWPGEDPVGRRFKHRLNPNFYTVVGVARDASTVAWDRRRSRMSITRPFSTTHRR